MQVSPKIGWQVAPLDFDVFDELYDLRTLIECHAAQLLAEAEARPALVALAEIWLLPEAERLADGAEVGRLDEQFHAQLVQGSGNREMARVHRSITERIRIIRRLDFTKPARVAATPTLAMANGQGDVDTHISIHVLGIRCYFRLSLIKLASLTPATAIRFSAIDPALVR